MNVRFKPTELIETVLSPALCGSVRQLSPNGGLLTVGVAGIIDDVERVAVALAIRCAGFGCKVETSIEELRITISERITLPVTMNCTILFERCPKKSG